MSIIRLNNKIAFWGQILGVGAETICDAAYHVDLLLLPRPFLSQTLILVFQGIITHQNENVDQLLKSLHK